MFFRATDNKPLNDGQTLDPLTLILGIILPFTILVNFFSLLIPKYKLQFVVCYSARWYLGATILWWILQSSFLWTAWKPRAWICCWQWIQLWKCNYLSVWTWLWIRGMQTNCLTKLIWFFYVLGNILNISTNLFHPFWSKNIILYFVALYSNTFQEISDLEF